MLTAGGLEGGRSDLAEGGVPAARVVEAGRHTVGVSFAYDGGGLGFGSEVTLSVDGAAVASGRLERTVPFGYSIVESLNVGLDWGTPVSERYTVTAATATTACCTA